MDPVAGFREIFVFVLVGLGIFAAINARKLGLVVACGVAALVAITIAFMSTSTAQSLSGSMGNGLTWAFAKVFG